MLQVGHIARACPGDRQRLRQHLSEQRCRAVLQQRVHQVRAAPNRQLPDEGRRRGDNGGTAPQHPHWMPGTSAFRA